jgi:TldD protein
MQQKQHKGGINMRVPASDYLNSKKQTLNSLVHILSEKFAYVSVLGTDVYGKKYTASKSGSSISSSNWTERGFVVRIHDGIGYCEFSFNQLEDTSTLEIADKISSKAELQLKLIKSHGININSYPIIDEEEIEKSFCSEVQELPSEIGDDEKLCRLSAIVERGIAASEYLANIIANYEEVQVSKLFISSKKQLEQSYIWTQGLIYPIVRKGDNTRYNYETFSGLKGAELLDEMAGKVEGLISTTLSLLEALPPKPGEYDVICTPKISGLIAHEAFGHGVEMDMFVKERAIAMEYLGKPVASKLVTMHDGAAAAKDVSSYLFDDEGTLGTDTVIISDGILKTGISDLLSSLRLGTTPTGNGKRESFERKAYARMTNTFFAPGKNTLEEMIKSIGNGYLLDVAMSGMEDPKNWGIQCMVLMGREIKHGRLTGKIVSPVILTGYVPDLLKSISAVSQEVELSGSGACGKGYKEWVKVSDGGPYIKARVRLG